MAIQRAADLRDTIHWLSDEQAWEASKSSPDRWFEIREEYQADIKAHLQGSLVPGRPRRGIVFLAVLYQGFFDPETSKMDPGDWIGWVGQQLVLSGAEISCWQKASEASNWICALVGKNRLPDAREVYRYFLRGGDSGLDGCLLALAWSRSKRRIELQNQTADICMRLFNAWWHQPDRFVHPPILVDGKDLQSELGLEPGPQIGRLLDQIRESQAEGSVTNRGQALELARMMKNQI